MATNSNISVNAVAVEDASLEFKSASFSAVNGMDSFAFNRRQLHHSWHSDDVIAPHFVNDSRTMEESDSERELTASDSTSSPSEDEVSLPHCVIWQRYYFCDFVCIL